MSGSSVPPESGDGADRSGSHRTDYAGAIYGSILAASVVATAGTAGEYPRLQAVVLLMITGLVFWATHVYAQLVGERVVGQRWSVRQIRRTAAHEWSIVEAATLPAVAVALSAVFGLSVNTGLWIALGVAVAQQVMWACLGAVRAGAPRGLVVAEGFVNLALGLIIVAAKVVLKH
ncbi:hypothetical protein [Streptomyces triticiradicis]|uniref:Integral membrane protein n=1 Tax=Streptomyces triticiradicis TaxID=2651189 RepID=A0A7J5DPH6_9ACTN|nr:hypothetical protein [Streptomyces triticiradicis]KAB1990680.1 hypothetical protein F8144_01735 [Streptomyces triticiradicis]